MSQAIPRLSAHALKELDRCGRKFALKYIQQAFWPGTAPEEQDGDAALRLGAAFHQLVQLHALKLSVEPVLLAHAEGGRLGVLWEAFLRTDHARPREQARIWTEQQLNFFSCGVPMSVRYDRLLHEAERWTILDWKTGRVDVASMANDWQTRLYRFALVEGGAGLGLGAIAPEAISLTYVEIKSGRSYPFPYDARQHAADRAAFEELAQRVSRPFDVRGNAEPFLRQPTHCKQCGYDSMCNPLAAPGERPTTLQAPRFVLPEEPPR